METRKLQISDDEIVVNISTKQAGFWVIIILIIIIAGIVGLGGFLESKYNLFQPNFSLILGLLTAFFLSNKLIWQSQKQHTMSFDKKHIVIYDSLFRGQVFKMEDIQNWCINPNYRLSLWTHILAVFTKDTSGCIAFNYANTNMPVYIGYGLIPSEAEELLKAIREKGWISDFQLSDAALENKKNKIMKYGVWSFLYLFTIGLILIIILNEPYKKSFFFIQAAFMIILTLFCFAMAIISYRQNRKNKSKMPNA